MEATVVAKNGIVYYIDPETKKCRKAEADLVSIVKDLELVDEQAPLTAYRNYLKDKFGEDAPIKKGKLHFRGYRIYADRENGFCIEDTKRKYQLVDHGFESIPSPKELAGWFEKPVVEHTPEELKAAVELGKRKQKEHEAIIAQLRQEEEAEKTVVDYEKLRRKVLLKIKQVEEGAGQVDPESFVEMIPFKQWKRKVNALVKEWKEKKIRYKKFLTSVKEVTTEQLFEKKEKVHRTSFTGTGLPEFKIVTQRVGDKLEVDGKLVDAVPFYLNYLLYYEPKAMQQLMRFAEGEVTAEELLQNPFHKDWKIEYKPRAVKNTADNAQLLSALCYSCGLVAPEDLVYGELVVGDKILILTDGEWVKNTVTKTDEGVELQKGIGLRKTDKWIKL